MKKLNLACGRDYREDHVNADISKDVKADVYFDALEFPYPIEDEEFDEIVCNDFIEHVPHVVFDTEGKRIKNDGFFVFLNELWRILKPGGTVSFRFPGFNDMNNYRDPTHTRRIMRENFAYYATPNGQYNFYTDKHWNILHYEDGNCTLQKVKQNE